MNRFVVRAFLLALCSFAVAASFPSLGSAQHAGDAREKLVADRFLDVLLRRPRPGTSLDRVYGYHVQAGTLDDLLADLKAERDNDAAEPGARQMLLGLMLLRRGNDAAAAEALAKAEAVRSDDAMASYYLGKALLRIGRSDEAAGALQRSIDRGPARNEALPVFTELGRLYQRGQQAEKALAVWNRLEQTFPGDPRVGEQIARTLAEEGQHEAALERYEKLARQGGSGDDARMIGYRIAAAELKRRLGDTDAALADLETLAGRLRPGSWLHADVRRRIEAVFLRGGDYSALAEYYARQVEQQGDDVALRRRLGQALAKAGRINDAEASLRETVNLAPEDPDARLALIDVLKSAAKADEACEQLERLVELHPDNPDYLVQLGNTWLDAAKLDKDARHQKAADAWRRLAQLRSDDAVVTAQVGDLMRRIESNDEALKLYRRAVELAPDQPQYREYLGEFLHRLDRRDEAFQTWAAIAAPPRDTRDNLIRLAEVLHTFDEPEKGLEAFLKAAELDLTFPQRLRLAELLSRSERHEDALAQLDGAEPFAETPEEREQLLQGRIRTYLGSGTLEEQIAEAREAAEQSEQAEDHRRLALMLDAAGRTADAIDAIGSAIRLAPEDTAALALAAELYRKAGRYGDAVDTYRSLSRLESRFLPSYLKRLAGLQMQLGQVNEALATAEELIQAQPGNPESYRFLAEQCFIVGRDADGIESLRRALRAAPRDREARQALASALANRFQTDEAIEIYWDLLDDAGTQDEQNRLVAQLAPLYERRGDLDQLVGRLEQRGREGSDMRSATLLISAAYRAVNDLGAARQTLEPLLAENPRDAELLSEMVTLAEGTAEPEAALGYQQQLVALADTQQNRNRLLKLMVDAGQIDQVEASLHQLRAEESPVEMIALIDRVIKTGDDETAIRFCETVLAGDGTLWEVRVRLAGLLLKQDRIDEALEQVELIESLDLPADTLSEVAKARQSPARSSRATSGTTTPSQPVSGRIDRVQYAYQLASVFRLGRYGGNVVSSTYPDVFTTADFGHAKYLATAYRAVAAAKQDRLSEFVGDAGDIDSIEAPEQLWNSYYLNALKEMFGPPNPTAMYGASEPMMQMLWRLAAIDEDERESVINRILLMRMQMRDPRYQRAQPIEPPEPLSADQLAVLRSLYEKPDGLAALNELNAARIYQELVAADQTTEAEAIAARFDEPAETAAEAYRIIRFQLATKRLNQLATELESLRTALPEWATTTSQNDSQSLASFLGSALSTEELSIDAQRNAVDLAIALQAIGARRTGTGRAISSGDGILNTYNIVDGQYRSYRVPVPFSQRLLPSMLAQQIYTGSRFADETSQRDRMLEHLSRSITVFPEDSEYAVAERKLRGMLDAFARWWADEPAAAYERIAAATEQYPGDHDLWIERARLAAELNRPQAALDALDAIEPLDQATLRVRELAAMNLATKLGRLERAKTAAQRLFGMRLDTATELALADQLIRLGMQPMATAVLQRSQKRGGQSITDLLQLAQRFFEAGERDAAAEVAYRTLRQIDSGSASNSDYYRRQAVQLLQQAGRMDALLAQAERRAAAAPHSLPLKLQLAELYTAAGRREDADKVFDTVAELQPNDPRTLWETGKRLAQAGKHGEAVDKFIAAFSKDPDQLQRGYYDFERSVASSKQFDKAFRALAEVDLKRFPSHYLAQAVNLHRRRGEEPSEAALAFIEHVLRNAPVEHLGDVLRNIRSNNKLLESEPVAAAVRRIFASDEVFQPGSSFWQRNSWGTGGNIYGPLLSCLEIIRARSDVETFVRERLAKRAEDKATGDLAKVLQFALDIESLDLEPAEQQLRELLAIEKSKIPYGLWWQLGQFYETKPGHEHLAVLALEHTRTYSGLPSLSEYGYTLDAKLTDVYVAAGEKEKAREGLLRGYMEMNNRERDRFDPGYDDYSDLRSIQSITEKLVKVDGRLDAVRIYADALADSGRFERAKQHTGRTDYADSFRKGLAAVVDTLDESDYDRFLTLDRDEPAHDADDAANAKRRKPDRGRFDLIALAPSPDMTPERSSIAALVVTSLAKSEQGRKRLERFQDELSDALRIHPADRSLLAMQALTSIVLNSESAAGQLRELTKSLPELPETTEPNARDDSLTDSDTIIALYSPAMLALAADDAELRSEADRLTDHLVRFAQRSERGDIAAALGLARFTGRDDVDGEQVAAMMLTTLDAIVPPSDSPGAVLTAVAQECLRVAETAAKAGAWEVSLEAIRRGLAGGPPLRTLPTDAGAGSAFSIPTQQRSISVIGNEQPQENLDWIAQRIAAMIQPDDEADRSESPRLASEATYAALKAAVFPPSRPGEVFPYEVNLLRSVGGSGHTKPDIRPLSLAGLLVESAVASGNAEDLAETLNEQRTGTKSPHVIDLIRAHLAVAQDDEAAASQALGELARTLGVRGGDNDAATSGQPAANLGPPELVAGIVLHAVLPVHEQWGLSPEAAKLHTHLLGEASRHKPVSDAGQWWRWITHELIASPDLDDATVRQASEQYLASIRLRYSNYTGSYGADRHQAESDALLQPLLAGRRWDQAAKLLRAAIERNGDFQSTGQTINQLAWELLGVDAESRYDLLSQVMLGENGEGPLQTSSNLVMFADPPAAFAPLFDEVKHPGKIPVASPNLPVVDLSLLIAEAAAQCDRTHELITRLSPHIGVPGDEAEAMIGLALLAAEQTEAAGEVLYRVFSHLQKTSPKNSIDTPMPIASSILAAKCLEVEGLRDGALLTWQPLLAHARRRNLGVAAAYYSRMAVDAGLTEAADAVEGSPLKHFHNIQMPYFGVPVSPTTERVYVVRNGTLRTAGGAGGNLLMLRYPLAGEFSFSHRNIRRGWGESHSHFGGVSYQVKPHVSQASVRALISRGTVELDTKAVKPGENVLTIDLRGDEVLMQLNETQTLVDQRTSSMPFVGLFFEHHTISEVAEIQLTGAPTIPRHVDLIDGDLRGWSFSIIGGSLPPMQLPLKPGQDAAEVQEQRRRATENLERFSWFVSDGELRSGRSYGSADTGFQSHLQYLRPLLDGESISYEFFHRAGEHEVHPTIGRVGVLLRPDGVKLRWLAQQRSLESRDLEPLHEVRPDELLGSGRPELREDDWNEVKLTADGDSVVVEVNGEPVCRSAMSIDRRFGLLGERERACRIRAIRLTGPWPETLPDNLLELQEQHR